MRNSFSFRRLIWILTALAWFYVLLHGVGPLPRLTSMLDLHGSFWGHRAANPKDVALLGSKERVTVTWDQAEVPHFFAANAADLFRAQGYVMASKRLFQMDLSSRSTLGRLSEWVGERMIARDRFFVRFGMRQAIAETLARYETDPEMREMLENFTAGVNAFIKDLKLPPPEYALLGVKPEAFTPERIIAMAKALTFSLSGRSFAIEMSQLKKKIGGAQVLDLFPRFLDADLEDYILPATAKGKSRLGREVAPEFNTHLEHIPLLPLANPGRGSNNWAVDAQKSTTGFSIFANDTHLNYSLPNIWFESQLSTPAFNVYGVSLVGIPGVVNGFNRDIAWGPTNGTTTVLDFFEVEFEDETSPRYKLGDVTREAVVQREVIKRSDLGAETIEIATTEFGPILHREGRYGLAARWTGFGGGQELKALRNLYAAKTYKECLASFRENWRVPIQNFICADSARVGIRHAGHVPKRSLGQGRFILDGNHIPPTLTETAGDKDLLELKDPVEHYVLSANQRVVGPGSNLELGWDYEEPFRGQQIRRRLEAKAKLSPEDFIAIQNDDVDRPAELILPLLLEQMKETNPPAIVEPIWDELKSWRYHARSELTAPTLFKAWFAKLQHNLFSFQITETSFAPKQTRIIQILKNVTTKKGHPDNQYLKHPVEDEVATALAQAALELEKTLGPDAKTWTWRRYNRAGLPHIARIPGWGRLDLDMNGSGESIRGNHGRHGPTYKAVVALGKNVRAWFQVPGGTEGDPLRPGYGRDVDTWAEGKMREVEYFQNVTDATATARNVQHFLPRSKD